MVGISRRDAFRHQSPVLVANRRQVCFAWVDKEDLLWARSVKWWPHRWFKDADPVARGLVDGRRVYLHREIARRAYGPAPSEDHVVEFRNGDRLDCRRANLLWVHKDLTTWRLEKAAAADTAPGR